MLNKAVANIICQIVFGRRFDYDEPIFQSMLHSLTEMAYLEGSIWALVTCSDTMNNTCTYNTVKNQHAVMSGWTSTGDTF